MGAKRGTQVFRRSPGPRLIEKHRVFALEVDIGPKVKNVACERAIHLKFTIPQ